MNRPTVRIKNLQTIVFSGVIAGTLDIAGAVIVYVVLLDKTTVARILQSIASGVFGKAAFAGGIETALYGLLFHFVIATSWAAAYFFIFPKISFLRKQKIVGGILYGIVVWMIMNLIVLPLSNVTHGQFTLQGVLTGVTMLIFFIGLPISLMIHRYYSSKTTS